MASHPYRLPTLAAAALLIALPPLSQAQEGDQEKPEVYGNWTVSCDTSSEQKHCGTGQILNDPKTNAAMLVVEFLQNKNSLPSLQITTPLGVLLQKGLQVDIDGTSPATIPFGWCEPIGCRTIIDPDEPLLEKFKNGTTFNITYTLLNKQNVTAAVSLRDLQKALTALATKKQ